VRPRENPEPAPLVPFTGLAARAPLGVWICVLGLLTAVAPLANAMYLPALPDLAADFGAGPSTVQLTLTTFLVGLALGHLVIGPLSDAWGRRRLLISGTVLCLGASALCAVAPTIGVFVLARFLQGFAGAAGVVLSRAMIVDRTFGDRTVRLFSLLMAINGIAPVLSPLVGTGLLGVGGWREIFLALTGLSLLMTLGALAAAPETLPPDQRVHSGLRAASHDIWTVLKRPRYLGFALTFAFAFATMFAYIAASPFVLQEALGLSIGGYALAYGTNAFGLVVASVLSGQLATRINPHRLLAAATAALAVLSVALLGTVLTGLPRWPTLVLLFLVATSLGFVTGLAAALASAEAHDLAGTGSALIGALQFGLGAVVAPLVGSSPVLMAVAMATAAVLAVVALAALTRARTAPSHIPRSVNPRVS
jgi:DHA1 family bicyclomycin/chloramphenicol resistance-like MFS transporter